MRLVRSWIAGNPYATGVNWSCALEPAFRVFSWLWAYHLAVDDLDERFHLEWLRGFYDHGRFIERHLELYSSPYNHLIAEAAALYMLGDVLSRVPRRRTLADHGARAPGRSARRNSSTPMAARWSSPRSTTTRRSASICWPRCSPVPPATTSRRVCGRAIERGLDFSMLAVAARRHDAVDRRSRRWQADPDGASALLGLSSVSGDGRRAVQPRRLQGTSPGAFTRTRCGCSAQQGSAQFDAMREPRAASDLGGARCRAATTSCAATGRRAPTTSASIVASRRPACAPTACRTRCTAMPTACRSSPA